MDSIRCRSMRMHAWSCSSSSTGDNVSLKERNRKLDKKIELKMIKQELFTHYWIISTLVHWIPFIKMHCVSHFNQNYGALSFTRSIILKFKKNCKISKPNKLIAYLLSFSLYDRFCVIIQLFKCKVQISLSNYLHYSIFL